MKEFIKQPIVTAILITLLIGGGMYLIFEIGLSNGNTMETDMNQSMEGTQGMESMEGMDH